MSPTTAPAPLGPSSPRSTPAISWRVPLLLLAGVLVVVPRPEMSTVWAWVAGVGALTLLDWALTPRPSVLRLTRAEPRQRGRHGEAATSALRVESTSGRRVHGVLRDAWQPTAGADAVRHRLRLPAGGSTTITTALLPVRRGTLRTDRVTVRLAGPLRLAARQAGLLAPAELQVLPAFASRRHLPSRLARLRELDGRAAIRVRGQGTEFDSLREYVRGDDVRSIDWRASARSTDVVVRTWQPERDRRVVLVLDTGRGSAGRVDDAPRLDAAMEAALLLTALATRAGDRVDVIAGDDRVRGRVKGGHSRDALTALQDELATIQPTLTETDWTRLIGAVDALGRHRGLVVLLTPVEPSAVLQGLLPVIGSLTRRHRVVVASVRDPEVARMARRRGDAEEAYGAAAAELAGLQRAHVVRLLGGLGVEVIDADADDLPPRLADHYLALKARGLL